MKRFILFAFVLVLGCHGVNTGSTVYCPEGKDRSNGVCCWWDHYYNKVAKECRYCACDKYGAKGGLKGRCDGNGKCYCYDDFKGSECQHCKGAKIKSNGRCCNLDHYFATWLKRPTCRYCACAELGSKGGRKGGCDGGGNCYCKEYYDGPECDKCEKGSKWSNGNCCPLDYYWGWWDNKCRWCACHEYGAKGGRKGGCNTAGNCYCKPNRKGSECQHCVKGQASNGRCCASDSYYSITYKKCRTCKCTAPGSKGGRKGGCDGGGYCYCYPGYKGMECQHRSG